HVRVAAVRQMVLDGNAVRFGVSGAVRDIWYSGRIGESHRHWDWAAVEQYGPDRSNHAAPLSIATLSAPGSGNSWVALRTTSNALVARKRANAYSLSSMTPKSAPTINTQISACIDWFDERAVQKLSGLGRQSQCGWMAKAGLADGGGKRRSSMVGSGRPFHPHDAKSGQGRR